MLSKLRLKMTLINAGVTMLLFVILICGVYLLIDLNTKRGNTYLLQRITDRIIANPQLDLPVRLPPPSRPDPPGLLFSPPRTSFFYIKLNEAGNITRVSSGVTVSENELPGLAQTVLDVVEMKGDLNYKNIPLYYQKTFLPQTNEVLMVFNDLTEEKESIFILLIQLLIVGVFCSLLSFIASFFLAKQALRPIQRAWEQQENFISDASHELRTPITIIQTNLDILAGVSPQETIEENKNWLNNIQDETSRMKDLINSLLFLARADAKQNLLEKEYFSLWVLIDDAVSSMQMIAKAKNITLEYSGTPSVALGDPSCIRQVLTILLDNAIRHTPPEGSVKVTCEPVGQKLCIAVIDSGEGIPAEHLEKIFDRFYQVDTSRNKGGSGLGLSIAKWITEQHQGTLRVTSDIGKGTVMILEIPGVKDM